MICIEHLSKEVNQIIHTQLCATRHVQPFRYVMVTGLKWNPRAIQINK